MAIFAVVGWVGQAWFAGRCRAATMTAQTALPRMVRSDSIRPAVRATPGPIPTIIPPALIVRTVAQPQELSAGANRLVAEMGELQLMAQGTGLELDSRQWSAFAHVVLRAEAARHAFEAEIATVKVIAPGRYEVGIPPYPDAGEALRGELVGQLGAELGEPVAIDVLAKLGERLEGRFAGFGVSAQALDITAPSNGAPGEVRIAQAVEYWNRAAGGDLLSTRREVHYPGMEDPTGETWGPLLAVVARKG